MITSLRRTATAGALLVVASVLVAGCDASTEPTAIGDRATELPSQPTAPSATQSAVPVTSEPPSESTSEAPTETPGATDGASDSRPASYRDAVAALAAVEQGGVDYQRLKRFVTPGDAVYCVLRNDYIPPSCEVGKGAVKDPDVCGQALSDQVGRIEFTKQGAQPQCNTDTIREPGAPVIKAPALVSDGSVSCAVEDRGVTCIDAGTRTGFFLTPGEYAAFG